MRDKERGSEERRQWKAKKEKKCRHHCKFRPVSACNFKGPVQSYLLSARARTCREEGRESEQAEMRVGFRCMGSSGGWSWALIMKEAETLLSLSKACSDQKIALYFFPFFMLHGFHPVYSKLIFNINLLGSDINNIVWTYGELSKIFVKYQCWNKIPVAILL